MAKASGSDHLEEGTKESLDFSKLRQIAGIDEDVLPVVVQDSETREVLIVAYVNRQALDETVRTGVATFWSTSRNELWVKGATSGNALGIDEIRVNCEQNSLVFLVTPRGEGACHTKDGDGQYRTGCYYRPDRVAGRPGVCLIAGRHSDMLPFSDLPPNLAYFFGVRFKNRQKSTPNL